MTAELITVLLGGSVYSPADPFATAMAVVGDTIAWIGSDAGATSWVEQAHQVVQLDGAPVTPAFVDAHVHATSTGLLLGGLDLSSATSLPACLTLLSSAARAARGLGVLLGHGWDETTWPERRAPTREEVDRATWGSAVYLSRVDVHSAVVSSALVAMAPQARGLPGWNETGPLSQQAHHHVRRTALDAVTPTQRRAAQQRFGARALELGIACVHEMAGPDISSAEDLVDLLTLSGSSAMPAVVGYWGEAGSVGLDRLRLLGERLAEQQRSYSDLIDPALASGVSGRLGGLGGDLFVDGAIGSRTALLRTRYTDQAGASDGSSHSLGGADSDDSDAGCGAGYLSVDQIADHLEVCTRANVQAGFHVIGDAAMDRVVAGLELAASSLGGPEPLRALGHRLEHVEMIDPDTIAQLVRFGVLASVQPVFDALWGGTHGMYATRLGVDRAIELNPFAAMQRAGLPLAFGSDAPVTSMGPWEAIRAAAHHRTAEHSISVRAAFAAHTRGARRAAGELDAGVLLVGARADYAVWSVSDLVVDAPDDRLAAWSTDPRSGVPGLPDLSEGTPAPTCLRTAVAGKPLFDRLATPF